MAVPFHQMRKSLEEPLDPPSWPRGIRLSPFVPERHAEAVHQLLETAYASGGGQISHFPEWWKQLEADDEYDPALVFLATDSSGLLVGVAHCWTSSFVKDLAVAASWRRRGIGAALLQHAFQVFRDRGATRVDLKVEIGNPHGATHLYRHIGMTIVNGAEGG